MSHTEKSVSGTKHTVEDYISWIEELLIYRGRIGLTSWESRLKDIAALTSVSDSPDARLGQNDLDLNGCLGNAVSDAERGQWLNYNIKRHHYLALEAVENLDERIDREISDLAVVRSLKGNSVGLVDKIKQLSKVEVAAPEYTIHLSATYPGDQKLSSMTDALRSFQMPFTASFGDFAAKLNSESLVFRPKGQGVNSGYSLEDGAWIYCLLNANKGVASKCKRITRKADYSAFVKSLSLGQIDKAVFWHETCPPILRKNSIEMTAIGPVVGIGLVSHAGTPRGVTAEEHAWLVKMHPIDVVDYAIELKDRGTRAFRSGNPTLSLEEYERSLTFMNYLGKDPPGTQKLCGQIRATLHLNSALMLLELHCFEEAIISSSEALKVADLTDRQMASAYYRRGVAYEGLSNKPKALEDLAVAFRLSPHDAAIMGMLEAVEQSLLGSTELEILRIYEKVKASALLSGGTLDKAPDLLEATTLAKALQATLGNETPNDYPSIYESVLCVCEIQTTDQSNRVSRGACDARTKADTDSKTHAKSDLDLPADFWEDWTSEVDEDGEPLDKDGKPFFEPYDPCGIVRAVLKDSSFP
ncbi:MAG: peptidyl-prolyl cis-trans isomerase cpr6 [Trichoglossum hirsutum]|nr:MAG: peptidyl-prolyl cis-trans isomerase cpr6 [Trichoglossum hirsutum]